MALANALDAIPLVADTTTRDALFPLATRVQDQRCFNKATGNVERWSGSAWVTDLSGASVATSTINAAIATAEAYTDAAVPANGRTTTTLVTYLLNNAVYNVKDYGVKGDGVTDDTTKLQALLNQLAGISARVYFPKGTYLTTGLTYTGSINFALKLEGEVETGQGVSLVLLKYSGAGGAGTYVLKWTGMNNSVVSGIAFHGNATAENCVWVDAANDTGGPISDYNLFDRCGFVEPMHAGGVAVKLGHTTGATPQLDMLTFRDCQWATTPGVTGKTDVGIKTYAAGNIKNITFRGGQISGFQKLADFTLGSGTILFDDVFLVGPTDGKSIIYGGQCELSLRDVKQEGGGSLVSCAGATSTYSSVKIDGGYWAATPSDDVAISVCGSLDLRNFNFQNNRTVTSLPLVVINNSVRQTATSTIASVHAFGNFFQYAANDDAHWPFQDGSGNKIPGFDQATQFYTQCRFALNFVAYGNFGGNISIASTVALKAFFPTGGEYVMSRISRANDVGTASVLVPSTGFINMLKGDTVLYRNEAGAGDVQVLAHNTDDTVQVGDTAGAKLSKLLLSTAVGKIVPGATSLSLRNNADSADNLLVTDAGIVTTRGDLKLGTVGNGLYIKEGANATQGAVALVAGTITVSTTKVTATCRIHVTSNVDGGTPGWLRVSARVNGTSFTITSSSGTDTSTVVWLLTDAA